MLDRLVAVMHMWLRDTSSGASRKGRKQTTRAKAVANILPLNGLARPNRTTTNVAKILEVAMTVGPTAMCHLARPSQDFKLSSDIVLKLTLWAELCSGALQGIDGP